MGFVMFLLGWAWAMLHERFANFHVPAGWIIDREFYQPAMILAKIGLLIFVGSTLTAAARWIYQKTARLSHLGGRIDSCRASIWNPACISLRRDRQKHHRIRKIG